MRLLAAFLLLIAQSAAVQIMYRVTFLGHQVEHRQHLVNGPQISEADISRVATAIARLSNNAFGTSRSADGTVLYIFNYYPSTNFQTGGGVIGEMQRVVASVIGRFH